MEEVGRRVHEKVEEEGNGKGKGEAGGSVWM